MALQNTSSDHCPVMYSARTEFVRIRLFRFENYWLHSARFGQMVKEEWGSQEKAVIPAQLHAKLCSLQRKIKYWTNQEFGLIKRQLQTCTDFISWRDKVSETRPLTPLEKFITSLIKRRITIISRMEEEKWRQRAKVKWEVEGDRNTKVFHAMSSFSKRKGSVSAIEFNGQQHNDQRNKVAAFFSYFCELMGKEATRLPIINWDSLYPTGYQLHDISQPIAMEEVEAAIKQWPNGKSLGPNGYTGEFYKHFLKDLLPNLIETLNGVLAAARYTRAT